MKDFESQPNVRIEHVESKDEIDFAVCREKIMSAIAQINASEGFRNPDGIEEIILENGITVSSPGDRRGKHATVLFLSIPTESGTFECVLRNGLYDAEQYKNAVDKNPLVAQFVPKLYDIIDGWVVMERLYGNEFAIKNKILEEDFRNAFAKNCAEAVYLLSSNKISIGDVRFSEGHNVIAKDDGSFRFIEQNTLIPDRLDSMGFSPNEVLADRLFDHLNHWKFSRSSDRYSEEQMVAHIDFEFQFISHLLNKVNPEDLRINYRYLESSHEFYKTLFNSYSTNGEFWKNRDFKELTEAEYEELDSSEKPVFPWVTNSTSRELGSMGTRLNPDFVKAVKEHDLDTFVSLLSQQLAVIPLDENDPANKVVVS